MDIQIYDSFQHIVGILAIFGYMMPMVKISPLKAQAYRFARFMTLSIFCFFVYQQTVNLYRVRHDLSLIINNGYTFIVILNVTQRVATVQLRWKVFDEIRDLINDPILAPRREVHLNLIAENTRRMNRIAKMVFCSVSCCSAFWLFVPLWQRFQHGYAAAYYPFDTATLTGFLLACFYDTAVMWWVGIGTMTYDTYAAALYSQSRVQVSIIRYDLEHFADDDGTNKDYYRDINNKEIKAQFVRCVHRYTKVTELNQLVEDIFTRMLLLQIFASALSICVVIYKISTVDSVNLVVMWMIIYLLCIMFELFLYCYFGTALYEESEHICESLYMSEWVHLSPAFRKEMLIAMARWFRPMVPLAARLVPMSLATFLRVLKGAYSLYTVLKNSSRR